MAILEDYPPIDMGLYAIFPGGRYLPYRVRALVDSLATRIGDQPPWDTLAERQPATAADAMMHRPRKRRR